jgi:hypothetical protein
MSEPSLEGNLRILVQQAVEQVSESDRPLRYFGGATAMQDMSRDQVITDPLTFEETRTALGALPIVQELYGASGSPDGEHAWERLTLQFGRASRMPRASEGDG